MQRADPRRYALLGIAAVILALLSATVSLPNGGGSAVAAADFYAAHRGAVVLAQAALVVAVLLFAVYASGLGGFAVRGATPRTWTGVRVAAVMLVVAVLLAAGPPLVLAVIAHAGHGTGWLHRWVRVGDLTDALRSLAVAFWCFMVAIESRRLPFPLRVLAAFAALVALVRAGLGVGAVPSALDAVAPGAFLVVVVLAAVWLLQRGRGDAGSAAPRAG